MERQGAGFDLIGDIHGHVGPLRRLLHRLGYHEIRGCYRHQYPERRVIFLGDFIDRGPQIRETLRIVRNMVEAGCALAVLGNHEYNALCFHSTQFDRSPLRGHTEKNIKQHKATLEAFAHEAEEWQAYLAWFKTLPLFLELPGLRAVHACWHEAALTALGRTTALGDQLLLQSATRGTREFRAIETLLKGLELQLPNCYSFEDRDGFRRSTIRVKWWLKMAQTTYRHLAYPECTEVPAQPVADAELSELTGYPPDEVPVFFGHYWLPPGQPRIEASNVACLDYSVAKGGSLVAYRWSGEQRLDDANFVAEPADGRLPVSLWKCHDREPE